jgi:hypothetical protein
MMQTAFYYPVTAFELEPAQGIELFKGEAGNQIDRLGRFLAATPDPPPEPRDQARSRKTDLPRRDLLAFQNSNLTPAAIAFPRQGAGLRCVRRGKNRSE